MNLTRELACAMWGVEDKDLDAFVEERVVPGTNMAILPPVMLTPRPGKYRLLSMNGGEDTMIEVKEPQRWIRL